MGEIEKAIEFLKEANRVLDDIEKAHDYPDHGEAFDFSADMVQYQVLLELALVHIEKAASNPNLLKIHMQRRMDKLNDNSRCDEQLCRSCEIFN